MESKKNNAKVKKENAYNHCRTINRSAVHKPEPSDAPKDDRSYLMGFAYRRRDESVVLLFSLLLFAILG